MLLFPPQVTSFILTFIRFPWRPFIARPDLPKRFVRLSSENAQCKIPLIFQHFTQHNFLVALGRTRILIKGCSRVSSWPWPVMWSARFGFEAQCKERKGVALRPKEHFPSFHVAARAAPSQMWTDEVRNILHRPVSESFCSSKQCC